MNFKDQVVIVTGGNGHIGLAIGLAFAKAEATVVLLGRNKEKGVTSVQILQDSGYLSEFYSVDLGDSDQVAQFYQTFREKYGTLHILINCAGAGESRGGTVKSWVPGQTHQQVEQRWQDMTNSNLRSLYLMSTLGADLMIAGSTIINITSTASIHGNYGLYGTMKAGAEGLTRSLAVELAPLGIRVNAVSPGWIKTANTLPNPDDAQQAAWEKQTSLLGRMGSPDEVASATLFLASPLASFITGETLRVDGGLTIIDPTTKSWRKMRS